MNKKLIAIGIAAALASPLAAQAGVEVYGQARASVDFANNNDTSTTNKDTAMSLSSNASRLGFKGDEDLGNGLSAVWQIEQDVGFDTGAFSNGARQTFVGLGGGFGTVLAGKLDTPYKSTTGQYDIFVDTKADYNAIMGSANGNIAFDNRTSNTLAYVTPNMNGFTGKVAYVMADVSNDDDLPISTTGNDRDAYSVSGNYANGPLNVSAAYESLNKASTTAGEDRVAWNLGGSYTVMDATTVALIYESIDLGGSNNDRGAIYANVAHKMGDTTLKLAVANADKLGSGTSNGATQISVGASQAMTKNTEVYALYSQISNDSAGAYGFKYGPANAVAGEDESVFSVGINHSFSSK